MKVALITEGTSEYKGVPRILDQIRSRTGKMVMPPLKASFQPDASPGVIARQTKSSVILARSNGASRVVIFIDRERQAARAGRLAREVETAIAALHDPDLEIRVVFKDRTFENWLVADLASLRAQPARFNVGAAEVRMIEPDKADSVDGERILNRMAIGPSYDKVPDSLRILNRFDVANAMRNSRSFRHFVHAIGDDYLLMSCRTPPK